MNCVLVTRQIHKTPPILKLTHNFEARVLYPFHIYLRSLKGKVVHWTLTLSQDLQVFMSQCTSPTFPFTSALPISFNRPGLFGRSEKSNAKYRGTDAQIFHRVGLFFLLVNYKGVRRKCKFQGNLCPILLYSLMYSPKSLPHFCLF